MQQNCECRPGEPGGGELYARDLSVVGLGIGIFRSRGTQVAHLLQSVGEHSLFAVGLGATNIRRVYG